MEEQPSASAPSEAPSPPKKRRTGLWVAIAVIIIVVALLGVYFSGILNAPAGPDLPTAVYLIGYPGDAIKIVPPWYTNRAQWPVKWMYSEGLQSQAFIDQLKSQGVDTSQIEGTAPTAPLNATYNSTSASFNTAFQTAYGHQPALFASNSYDAVFVIALAMEQANSTNTNSTAFKAALRSVTSLGGEVIYPGQWLKARQAIENGTKIKYFGASGSLVFDSNGEVSSDYEVWNINATGQISQKLYIPDGSWVSAASLSTVHTQSATRAVTQALTPAPKIGTVMSITGSLALFGFDDQNGTDLAANQINAQGGIRGSTLTMVHQDDATDPTTGASAAQAEITAGVQAIVGSLASSVSQAVFAKVVPAGIIEMSPASTSPYFTTADTTDQFWRTVASDALQGQAAAYYAYNFAGYRKMSVMYINNAYGQGLSSVFISAFKARGGTIYRSVSFEAGQASYTSQLNTLFTPGVQTASLSIQAVWRDS